MSDKNFGGAGEGYDMRGFEKEFGIKTAFGPPDENGNPKWSRCWSDVPYTWAPAIHRLLDKIRAKYRVEGLDDVDNDPRIQVVVDQIKVKFGSLRFYFSTLGENWREIEDEIDGWVDECEQELKELDPYYGVPY